MSNAPERVIHSISTGSVVKTILIILFFGLLYYIRDIILILLTAVIIASAIEPGTMLLVKRKIPRVIAVILLYLLIIVGILALSYLVLPSFISDLAGFMDTLPDYVTTINVGSENGLGNFFGLRSAIQGLSESGSLGEAVKNISGTLSMATGNVLATLSSIFGGITSVMLIFILSFYLSVKERGVEEFLRIVTPARHEGYIIGLWRRTQHKIGRWIQGQFILAVIVGVLVFIGLTALRVEHAFLFALISAVFEVIPIFGPIIGAVPGVLAGILQGGLTFGLIVALLYIIVQQIESNIIYPLVFKRVLDIHPLVVIIAILIGGKIGGILGALISVPVAAALMEFVSDVNKNKIAAREKQQAAAGR